MSFIEGIEGCGDDNLYPNNWDEVNLFARLRHFEKMLNMSMLKCFFEVGTDKTLFNGMAMSREMELCGEYMGEFYVIFISLKGVDGLTYDLAIKRFKTITEEAIAFWKKECMVVMAQ